jgi:NAD(P)-dependent dehydrogenase (short-subunit alcohol dehydrogenase family)
MARVFITGSSDGLGLMAGRLLIEEGHSVIAHARSEQRAGQTRTALPGAEQVVTGDLSSIEQTRGVADQVNALGDVASATSPRRSSAGATSFTSSRSSAIPRPGRPRSRTR